MAIGTWDDFTGKFGFQDGAATDAEDFVARDHLVAALNEHPAMKKEKITAVGWDRPGMHNGCIVLLFSNPHFWSANKLLKTWQRGKQPLWFAEAQLPDGVDVNEMISDAYYQARHDKLFSSRELATVLAALRHWQATVGEGKSAAMKYPDHFRMSGQKPLTLNQIDGLCERINC